MTNKISKPLARLTNKKKGEDRNYQSIWNKEGGIFQGS